MPSGSATGPVAVTVGGQTSNGVNFTVQSGSGGGITLVQHTSIDAGSGGETYSGSLAFAANNTSGNWIGVCVRAGKSSATLTVTDSLGNTYKRAALLNMTDDVPDGDTLAIFYAENIPSGANTITVTDSLFATLRFAIFEYSGVATSNSLDVTAQAQDSSASPNSGTATTTAAGDLLLGAVATADEDNFTAAGGFAIEESVPAAPNPKVSAADQIQTAAGAASISGSLDYSDPWGAIIAAFKKAP